MKKLILLLLLFPFVHTNVFSMSLSGIKQWSGRNKLLALITGGFAVGGISLFALYWWNTTKKSKTASKKKNDVKNPVDNQKIVHPVLKNITILSRQENLTLEQSIEKLENKFKFDSPILISLYNAIVDTIENSPDLVNKLIEYQKKLLYYFDQNHQDSFYFVKNVGDKRNGANLYCVLIKFCIDMLVSGKKLEKISLEDNDFKDKLYSWYHKYFDFLEDKLGHINFFKEKLLIDNLSPERIFNKAIELSYKTQSHLGSLDSVVNIMSKKTYFFCDNSEVLYQLCRFYDFKNKKAYENKKGIFNDLMGEIITGDNQEPHNIQGRASDSKYGDQTDFQNYNLLYMSYIVWLKFSTNPNLKDLLINTGDQAMHEMTVNDDFWGVNHDYKGKNNLGKLLQYIRYCFKKNRDFISEIRGKNNQLLEKLYNEYNNTLNKNNPIQFYEGVVQQHTKWSTETNIQYSNMYQQPGLILTHDKFLEDIEYLRNPPLEQK